MPVVVKLVNKRSKKEENKSFKNMEDFEKWVESPKAENYEVEKIMNEQVKADGEDSATMSSVSSGNKKNKRNADKTNIKEPMNKSRQDPNVEDMKVDGSPEKSSSFGKPSGKSSMVKEMISAMTKMSNEELEELYSKTVDVASENEASISDLVKEEFNDLFEGDETFSEDFKKSAFVIFESAVLTKLQEEKEKLEEEFEERLQEEISSYEDKLNDYVKHAVNEWVEENEKSLGESIKADLFDSLVSGMKNLFLEHSIALDESSVDVIENLNNKIDGLKEDLNKIQNEKIELENKMFENECEKVFYENVSDLTDTQREKLEKIANKMTFESVEDFSEKITMLKESYFEKGSSKSEIGLNEEYQGEEVSESETVDPKVKAVSDMIRRQNRTR